LARFVRKEHKYEKYFKKRIKVPAAFQVIDASGHLKQVERGTFIVGLDRFLQILP